MGQSAFSGTALELFSSPTYLHDQIRFVPVDERDGHQSLNGYGVDPAGKHAIDFVQVAASLNRVPGVRIAGFELGGGADPQSSGVNQGRGVFHTPRAFAPAVHDINAGLIAIGEKPLFIRPLVRSNYGVGLSELALPDLTYFYGAYAQEFGAGPDFNNPVMLRAFNAQNAERIGGKLDARDFIGSIVAISSIRKGFVDQLRLLQGEKDVSPVPLNVSAQLDVVYSNDERLKADYFYDNLRAIKDAAREYGPGILAGFGIKDMIGGLRPAAAEAVLPKLLKIITKEDLFFSYHSHDIGYTEPGKTATEAAVAAALAAIEQGRRLTIDVSMREGGGFPSLIKVVEGITKHFPAFAMPPAQLAIAERAQAILEQEHQAHKHLYIDSDFLTPWQLDYSRSAGGGVPVFIQQVVMAAAKMRAKELARRDGNTVPEKHMKQAMRDVGDLAIHISHEIAYDISCHKVTPAMMFADRLSHIVTLAASHSRNGRIGLLDEMLATNVNFHEPLPQWREKIRELYADMILAPGLIKASVNYFVGPMPLAQDPFIFKIMRTAIFDDVLPANFEERRILNSGALKALTAEDYKSIRAQILGTDTLVGNFALNKSDVHAYLTSALAKYAGNGQERSNVAEQIDAFVNKYIGIDESDNPTEPVLEKVYQLVTKLNVEGSVTVPLRDAVAAVLIMRNKQKEISEATLQYLAYPAKYFPFAYSSFMPKNYEGPLRTIMEIRRTAYDKTKIIALADLDAKEPALARQVALQYFALPANAQSSIFSSADQQTLNQIRSDIAVKPSMSWSHSIAQSSPKLSTPLRKTASPAVADYDPLSKEESERLRAAWAKAKANAVIVNLEVERSARHPSGGGAMHLRGAAAKP